MFNWEQKIKEAITNSDTIKKYESLSKQFDVNRTPYGKGINKSDKNTVMNILESLGYTAKYDRREKFYKLQNVEEGSYIFRMHLAFELGNAEIIWVVYEGDKLLLGSPLGVFPQIMIDPDYLIKPPRFKTYEELREILEIAFKMFDDFKKELIKYDSTNENE